MREVILTRSAFVQQFVMGIIDDLGVSATPRCLNFAEAPCAYPAFHQRRAPALPWFETGLPQQNRALLRRGGPSIRVLGVMPHSGIIACTRSISRVRGVRWLMRHPGKIATTSAIKRCSRCSCGTAFLFINGSPTMPAKKSLPRTNSSALQH